MILTRPDLRSLRSIGGDGHCMFCSLSYVISGSEEHHFEIRLAIVAHMLTIPHLVSGIGPDSNRNYLVTYDAGYRSVEDYLVRSRMGEDGTCLNYLSWHIYSILLCIPSKEVLTTIGSHVFHKG